MVYLYDACDQISDFCHQQLQRKMRQKISWMDGRTDRGKTVYPPPTSGNGGIKKQQWKYTITTLIDNTTLVKYKITTLIDNTTPVKYKIATLIDKTIPVQYTITTFIDKTTPVKYKIIP